MIWRWLKDAKFSPIEVVLAMILIDILQRLLGW